MKMKRSSNISKFKRIESKHSDSSLLLSSIIESSKDMVIFSLDKNYCYTIFDYNRKSMFFETAHLLEVKNEIRSIKDQS